MAEMLRNRGLDKMTFRKRLIRQMSKVRMPSVTTVIFTPKTVEFQSDLWAIQKRNFAIETR